MRLEPTPAAGGASGGAPPPTGPASGRGAAPGAPAAAPGSGAVVAAAPHIVLRGPEVPAEVVADLGAPPRLFDNPSTPAAAAAAAGQRRMLRATNRERGGGSRLQAEVSCVEGRATVWTDALRGAAVAACGTHNFAAVGLADGQLMVRVPGVVCGGAASKGVGQHGRCCGVGHAGRTKRGCLQASQPPVHLHARPASPPARLSLTLTHDLPLRRSCTRGLGGT